MLRFFGRIVGYNSQIIYSCRESKMFIFLVMKLVGEGMAKYYQKDNIKLLGIASWECGMFRDELEEYQTNIEKNDAEKV